jgi:hypothetical protein
MPGLSSLGPRAKRDRPSTVVTQKPRLRPTSSAGKSRTGRIKEHTVSMPLGTITRPILRNPYRTTSQGRRLGECSGAASIPGQALAPRRARPYSLSRNLASIRARKYHILLPSTVSHVHRHITLHSWHSYPTRIIIHCPQPCPPKFGPPALYFSPVLGPPPASHSV